MFQARLPSIPIRCLVLLAVLGLPWAAAATDVRVLHSLLDSVLESNVRDGYVDYPAIARNVRFFKYLEGIADFDVESLATDEQRLAFWINAYNALAIKTVIDGGTPLTTIGRLKFFRTTEHRVAGRELDLRSIEQDVIAKFDEPLAFFGLVSAAYSSPKLRSEAYRSDKLLAQLRSNARDFVNDNRKNRFSDAARKAKLSELFDWHEDAFGGDDEGVLKWVAKYLDDEQTAAKLRAGEYAIDYLDFDWSINGRPM